MRGMVREWLTDLWTCTITSKSGRTPMMPAGNDHLRLRPMKETRAKGIAK